MKIGVFSVRDSKANAFMQPFYSQTPGTALRRFEATCMHTESDFFRYSEDYTLYHLGWFDDASGETIPCEQGPEPLATAAAVVGAAEARAEKNRAKLRALPGGAEEQASGEAPKAPSSLAD